MAIRSAAQTPRYFWVVAVASIVWNSGGPIDYTMTKTHNAAYLASATPAMREWLAGYPWWMEMAWALGVWCALLGSLLLLVRSRLAVPVFAVSLGGLIVSTAYQFGSGTMPAGMRTPGAIGFTAALWVVAIALLWFAHVMRRREILR